MVWFFHFRFIPRFLDACTGVLKEGADRDPDLLEQASTFMVTSDVELKIDLKSVAYIILMI